MFLDSFNISLQNSIESFRYSVSQCEASYTSRWDFSTLFPAYEMVWKMRNFNFSCEISLHTLSYYVLIDLISESITTVRFSFKLTVIDLIAKFYN